MNTNTTNTHDLLNQAADLIIMLEREFGIDHRAAIAQALQELPKAVAVAWANDVLLNGPKPSWTKQQIIDAVTA
jgi:biotin-(acetyl-CoA carboxylase) ligase